MSKPKPRLLSPMTKKKFSATHALKPCVFKHLKRGPLLTVKKTLESVASNGEY